MYEGFFGSRLDLLVTLTDTTTGMEVEERNVSFYKDGKRIRPEYRGSGNYIFINTGRDNGLMLVEVRGFEPCSLKVDYDVLNSQLPMLEAFLIPSEKLRAGEPLLTLSGKMAGLKDMQAINPERPLCSIREYDARRHIMTLFLPSRRLNLVHRFYGLANVRDGTFESFEVERELPDKKIRTKSPLQKEFVPNSPICRILYGQVDEEGNYLMRVRDNSKRCVYLVKYTVDAEEKFSYINFSEMNQLPN